MKKFKTLNLLASALVISICISSCKKEDKAVPSRTGTATFYTLSNDNWSLILDGVEKGKIKNTTQMPVCGDAVFQVFTLSAGTHTVDAKSLDGFAWGHQKTITISSGGCVQIQLP